MSREIRRMNLAGMSDEDLAAVRQGVAGVIGGDGQDFDHLLGDIDHELELRTREPQ